MNYNNIIKEIEEHGFDWERIREIFPFASLELREGEYQTLLSLCLKSLSNKDDKELLLELLDAQWAVYLEQLWIENEKSQGADNSGPVHFVLARLQIHSNLRHSEGLRPASMRTRMMNIGGDNTIAKLLFATQ